MSSSLRRGALAAAAIVVSVAPLSACGAGNDAQTLEVKPDNAATAVGDIKIQNATVVTQPDRKAKGPAVVTGRLFNNGKGAQTVKAITLPGTKARVKLSPAKGKSGPVVVPAGGSVAFGGKGNASAVISDGREAAKDGNAERVVFDLSSTGNIPVTAFVVPATSYFKGWGPSQLPTAKPSGSATPGGTPSGTPSGKPSGTPSGTATNKPGDTASGQPGSESGGATNGIATGEPTPNGGGH
ncbi:DUF461 domain-containing protein [Streptomyces yatensis]|uniref:Lipoprotein n=1 Tax=Streptomyces yatensis TaxID=155177 RepID=A0ABP4RYS6_9ACTN|nr:DUF461 domain-containing protein [Streptomyces yatensis]